MGFWTSLQGQVEAELTSADIPGALRAIAQAGISLRNTVSSGELTLRFTVPRQQWRELSALIAKRGETLTLLRRHGVYWQGKGMLRRPVLLMGLFLILLAAIFLPGKIFFVQVEGNETIPARLILAEAEECGICFGASRRAVRSEKMKNALLDALPELQWAGVNTNGCVAVISVREKTAAEEGEQDCVVSNLIASRDGMIVSLTAVGGNPVCRVGQTVQKGQILVSGYTDCGLSIRASRSKGEIFAQTQWDLEAVSPSKVVQKQTKTAVEKKYALIIGKKRINFYKDSGISGTTCDKMSVVNYLTLPGGFTLPVALVTEETTSYRTQTVTLRPESVQPLLDAFAQSYLKQQMIAGRILRCDSAVTQQDDAIHFTGRFACCEMIGREQIVEELDLYGKDN